MKMYSIVKRVVLFASLLMVSVPEVHAQARRAARGAATAAKIEGDNAAAPRKKTGIKDYVMGDHFLGGELGYNQLSPLHVGFRYATYLRWDVGNKILLELQPTAGAGTGYNQWLRLEGGANFGIGTTVNNVTFFFSLLGAHLQMSLASYGGVPVAFGIGPSFQLPLSVNVYWKDFLFGLHWGYDWTAIVPASGLNGSSFYFNFVVAYRFKKK